MAFVNRVRLAHMMRCCLSSIELQSGCPEPCMPNWIKADIWATFLTILSAPDMKVAMSERYKLRGVCASPMMRYRHGRVIADSELKQTNMQVLRKRIAEYQAYYALITMSRAHE